MHTESICKSISTDAYKKFMGQDTEQPKNTPWGQAFGQDLAARQAFGQDLAACPAENKSITNQ